MYTLVQTHTVERLFYFIHIILQSYDVFFQDTTTVLLFVVQLETKAQEVTEVFENGAPFKHKSQPQQSVNRM